MSSKVNTAVIGLGVGMAHGKGYNNCPGANLYAVCDIDEERLETRGEELGVPKERRFTDYEKLLALPDLDAVSIALPNYLHNPAALAAFQAGKHVLSEKPLATSAAAAEEMVAAGHRAGKTLMVCFNYRYREDARWLKGLQQEGKMGKVYFARAGWQRNVGIPGFGGWFTQKKASGGGPLIDLGVHILDLTLWLMDRPQPVAVSGATFAEFGPRGRKASGADFGPGGTKVSGGTKPGAVYDVEDLAVAFIRFANGEALQLETSWATQTKPGRDDYFVTLYGTEGGSELYVPNYADRDTVNFYTEEGGIPVQVKPAIVARAGGHELAVAHFVKSIQDGTQPESTGEQGLALMRLIDAIYESARTGREVRLD